MTGERDAKADPEGSGPGRLSRVASGVVDGVQKYKAGRPIARVDVGTAKLSQAFSGTKFVLYDDRIETPKGTHPLTPAVHAEVEAAGGFQKRVDRRELYLNIEGDGWSIARQCDPKKGEKLRQFAHAVNSAVQALAPSVLRDDAVTTVSGQEPSPAADAADAIRKLGELRQAGVLTEAEFAAKKRELLDRM
jgi:Short C-terminal domain